MSAVGITPTSTRPKSLFSLTKSERISPPETDKNSKCCAEMKEEIKKELRGFETEQVMEKNEMP